MPQVSLSIETMRRAGHVGCARLSMRLHMFAADMLAGQCQRAHCLDAGAWMCIHAEVEIIAQLLTAVTVRTDGRLEMHETSTVAGFEEFTAVPSIRTDMSVLSPVRAATHDVNYYFSGLFFPPVGVCAVWSVSTHVQPVSVAVPGVVWSRMEQSAILSVSALDGDVAEPLFVVRGSVGADRPVGTSWRMNERSEVLPADLGARGPGCAPVWVLEQMAVGTRPDVLAKRGLGTRCRVVRTVQVHFLLYLATPSLWARWRVYVAAAGELVRTSAAQLAWMPGSQDPWELPTQSH